MSNTSINLTDELHNYLLTFSLREDRALRSLREETMKMKEHNMQISPEQGQFMSLLIKLIGGKMGIEVGVFTGYSALCVALALPHYGKLVALDISEKWTNIGKRYWKEAGVDHKIDLHIGPALDSLKGMLIDGKANMFDFAFIDADKENYEQYYEYCLQLIRPNGLIIIDNVLWDGKVIDHTQTDVDTAAIRALNEKLHKDERVDLSMLPISDGLTLVRKRSIPEL